MAFCGSSDAFVTRKGSKRIPGSEQTAQIGRVAEQRGTRCPGGWEIVSPTYNFLAFEVLDLNPGPGPRCAGTAGGEAGPPGQVLLELPGV